MAREVADLGFEYMELSHGVRITLVPGLLKALEEGVIRVSSCHNFCPLPAGVTRPAPNLYQPSSQDRREIEQWLRNTKRSLDFAAQVGAGVLVCHLGSVGFFWFNPANKLYDYLEGLTDLDLRKDEAFRLVREKALRRLQKRKPRYWETVLRSLQAILEHAKTSGVKLGFENRESFTELPLDADFGSLFAAMPEGAPVGYWHDAGHADLKEKLGLLDHAKHLGELAPRLLGFHLHDVSKEGHDHQPLGTGRVDFDMVSSHWQAQHRLILELSPRLSTEEVLASRQRALELIDRAFAASA
jgi:sugar phosphate isomerase/epimerase